MMTQPLITSSQEFSAIEYNKFQMMKNHIDEYSMYIKHNIFNQFDDYSILLIAYMKKKIFVLNSISRSNMLYKDYERYLDIYLSFISLLNKYIVHRIKNYE